MAATLSHAQPVLAAASSSGFRESGLQSLRCLEYADSFPIIAVRSSGLSLESIIGYCEDDNDAFIHSFVTEEYLAMLVAIANERFAVNADRKERFWKALRDMSSPDRDQRLKNTGWEDPEKRRQRKMAEGLLRKKQTSESRERNASNGAEIEENLGPIDGFL